MQEPNFHDASCSRIDNHSSVSSATSPGESSLDNGKKTKQKLLHKTPNPVNLCQENIIALESTGSNKIWTKNKTAVHSLNTKKCSAM